MILADSSQQSGDEELAIADIILLHNDRDFDPFERHLGLHMVKT